MRRFVLPTTLLISVAAMSACGREVAPKDASQTLSAEQFLKWSMDQYKGMRAFSADVAIMKSADQRRVPGTIRRTIRYVAPNKFDIRTDILGLTLSTVSNGKSMVEFGSASDIKPVQYPASDGLDSAGTIQLTNPVFAGSPLYRFFGGGDDLPLLADTTKKPIAYGDEEWGDDEPTRFVTFYAKQDYGNVQVLIGGQTGRVYRIEYDSDPITQGLKNGGTSDGIGDLSKLDPVPATSTTKPSKVPEGMDTTEVYSKILTDPAQVPADFDVRLPAGAEPVQMPTVPSGKPPVPIGTAAPDFIVQSMRGRKVRLSSLRGKVVLLDFWATWCPPCLKGLPDTAKLSDKGEASGMQVMAISGESRGPVNRFLRKQEYKLPAYLDEKGIAAVAYKAQEIPTVAIVDPNGKLAAYFVGLQDPATLEDALRKAGARL